MYMFGLRRVRNRYYGNVARTAAVTAVANQAAKRLFTKALPRAIKSTVKGASYAVNQAVGTKPVKKMDKPPRKADLKKRVALLEKKSRDEISRVVYKWDNKDVLRPSASQALNGFQEAVSISQIELALAQARFFDPATPGTLITASLASPTYTQSIGVSVSSICIIRNNYQIPCYVYYGVISPKVATSTSPTTAWTNGLTDAGAPTATSYLLKIRDSQEFTDTYKGKIYSVKLMPGQMITLKKKTKMFDYDPSYFDTNTQTYQPKAKSSMFFYRVHGLFGHDSAVTTEQGIMPCGIDIHCRNTYTIYYNSGGAAVKTIVLNQNASSSFTNGAVSSQIVVDNQSYSLA